MGSDQSNTTSIELEPEGYSLQPVTHATPATPNEEELIARVCSGERACFHDLIRPYTKLMFASALAVPRNPADAEEAVQEAALKAFLHLATLEERARFRAWLLQIVINEARMHRRHSRAQLFESIDQAAINSMISMQGQSGHRPSCPSYFLIPSAFQSHAFRRLHLKPEVNSVSRRKAYS